MKLYDSKMAPNPRRVRIFLAEKGIEVELVEEAPWEKRMDYLRQNPSGKVPMLKIDGRTLAESSA